MTTFTGIYTGPTPNELKLVQGEQYTMEVHSHHNQSNGQMISAVFHVGTFPPPPGVSRVDGMALENVEVFLVMWTEVVVGSSGLKKLIVAPRNN